MLLLLLRRPFIHHPPDTYVFLVLIKDHGIIEVSICYMEVINNPQILVDYNHSHLSHVVRLSDLLGKLSFRLWVRFRALLMSLITGPVATHGPFFS